MFIETNYGIKCLTEKANPAVDRKTKTYKKCSFEIEPYLVALSLVVYFQKQFVQLIMLIYIIFLVFQLDEMMDLSRRAIGYGLTTHVTAIVSVSLIMSLPEDLHFSSVIHHLTSQQ